MCCTLIPRSGASWLQCFVMRLSGFVLKSVTANVSDALLTFIIHFFPANYLVKDLIAEILLLCANEQLSPNEYLLRVCGSEEFLQM